jgi:hypothetical protein
MIDLYRLFISYIAKYLYYLSLFVHINPLMQKIRLSFIKLALSLYFVS